MSSPLASRRPPPGTAAGRAFRFLVIASLVSAVAQVTLGGVVRVTGSGLGCPDWPLCDGRVIPVYERTSIIEFTHRMVASILGLLTLSSAVLAWQYFRTELRILVPCLAGAVLVLVAALLGAAVVLTELSWWVRLIHLGIAEGVVACFVVAAVVSSRSEAASGVKARSEDRRLNILMLASVVGVFALILSGSYMVGYGAGSSCATWPLCRGSLMPDGTAYAIHMGHRYLAAAIGLIVAAAAVAAWRRRASQPALGQVALLIVALLGIQTMIGAATVWAEFSTETRAAHLGGATLLWTAVVALTTVCYVPRGLGLRTLASRPIAEPRGIRQ